ncbi:zinc finger protein 287-like [Contarinia nasturtii]|uniref:zinc finger protein 287-like n=1 Tax=Contarinia nasturtii TaxID=265458 RepID=UPI0012D4AC9A|nr:zinc finger protein 287-like [Contarinia nasturtii]
MDSDPGEGTLDGRVRRKMNDPTAEIKQEPDVKEEPPDDIEFSLIRTSSPGMNEANGAGFNDIKSESETDDDMELAIDPNCVKDEIKCEEVEEEEMKKHKLLSSPNGSATNNTDNDNKNGPSGIPNGKKGRHQTRPKGKGKKDNQPTAAKKAAKKYHCTICNYVAPSKSKLLIHSRVHSGDKPFVCDICFKNFTQKSDLNRHKIIHTKNLPHHCSKCQHGFAEESDKNDHEQKCKRRHYKCGLCEFNTQQKSNLQAHMQIHSGDKPNECPICFKGFTTKNHLKKHLRTHKDQLPFGCSKCGTRFATTKSKQLHEERCTCLRYNCYLCSYKCFYKTELQRHIQSKHTGEKQFQCHICDKRFTRNYYLSQHMAVHHDQFPFRCSKCRLAFSQERLKIEHETKCGARHYQCW